MADFATPLPTNLTADQFLNWTASQPDRPRYELHQGNALLMAPERTLHAQAKLEVAVALRSALAGAGQDCRAYIDGLGVRIADDTVYILDAFVQCGEQPDRNATETSAPVIVVEVLSPSTQGIDHRQKLEDYFKLASVEHYLIIDPDARRVVHHRRQLGTPPLGTQILAGGVLQLEPPGISLQIDDIFAGLPDQPEDELEAGGE